MESSKKPLTVGGREESKRVGVEGFSQKGKISWPPETKKVAELGTRLAGLLLDPITQDQQQSGSMRNPCEVCEKKVDGTNNMKSMLDNAAQDGDLTLVLHKGRTTVKVHKSILSACSPVFRLIIETGLVDDKLLVDCVSVDGMQIALSYIYCEELPVEGSPKWTKWTEIPDEILYMAGKYQLDGLKTFCNDNIKKVCKFENAARLLHLSRRFEMESSVAAVKGFYTEYMDYLVKNCEKAR